MTPPAAAPTARRPWAPALALGLVLALLNAAAWGLLQAQLPAPDHIGPLAGLSYSGAGRWDSPLAGDRPDHERLAQDLALLSRHTRRIRTYAASDHPELPALAREHGLEVLLGAYLSDRLDHNQRELRAAIAQAQHLTHVAHHFGGKLHHLTGLQGSRDVKTNLAHGAGQSATAKSRPSRAAVTMVAMSSSPIT